MPGWALLAILAALVVAMILSRRRNPQRVDWAAFRLFMKRRKKWAGKPVRTDHTQTITVQRSDLRVDQNAMLNKLIAERDLEAVAGFMQREAGWEEARAIDYAERLTGREHGVPPPAPPSAKTAPPPRRGFRLFRGPRRVGFSGDDEVPEKAEPRPVASREAVIEGLPPEAAGEITALLDAGRKIEAIKRAREITGLGLREAKDMVDDAERRR